MVDGRGVNVVGAGAGSLVGRASFGEAPLVGLSALIGLGVFGFVAASTGTLASLCDSIGDCATGLAGGGIAWYPLIMFVDGGENVATGGDA